MRASTDFGLAINRSEIDRLPWRTGARLILVFSVIIWFILLLPVLLTFRVI
jgi:hypothetical protein